MLTLGPFRPDIADTNPGILADLLNATIKPDSGGVAYGPASSLDVASTAIALPSAPKGALTCVTASGVYRNFIATSTNIYLVAADGTYSSVGSGFALPSGDQWGRCQFGSKAIFSNTFDGQWEYDIEGAGSFTAISGAPKARVLGVMFDTIFAGDCDGEAMLLRNSDYNYSNWTSGVAGYQPMPDGEEIVGFGEVRDGIGIVLQRNAIRLLQRVPDASHYAMRLMSLNQGAVNPQCVVNVRGALYYCDVNGIHRVTAAGVEDLGANRVNRWLINRIATEGLNTIEGAYDPNNEVVRFRYQVGTDASTTVFTNLIDYSINNNEFVPIQEQTSAIFTTATTGYTLEELDAFGTLDSLTLSLDDRFWFGGAPRLGAMDENYKLGYFSGAALAFMAETTTLSDNKRSRITSLRPITDADDVTVRVGRSDRLADALTWNTAAGIQPSGRVAINPETGGKNHRIRANIPAGSEWTFMRGFDDIMPKMAGPK